MIITKENFAELLPSLKMAASVLKGSARRMYLGQLALNLGRGGKSVVSRELGISRQTLRKGIGEVEGGQAQVDNFQSRGRKPLEETCPELLLAIQDLVDGASQIDSKFTSTRLYTRLSAPEVRTQLIKRGFEEAALPTNQTIYNKMGSLGYKRKKVLKTKPKKKIKETDAIFNELAKQNQQADETAGVLRISYDAKNRVSIGNFSRGGKNWSKLEASDHDFTKQYLTPFGLFLPEFKETNLYFTRSKVTADFIVDTLMDYWTKNKARFKHIHTLVLHADNGPECHSRRTQFIKRICEFASDTNLTIKLVYYPPYHSKYNPVERVWGGLEQHWNGDIMDTKETVLKFAKSFVWAGKKASVTLSDKIYKIGKKLSTKAMDLHEKAIDRLNKTIGKWFVTICPQKVKNVLLDG